MPDVELKPATAADSHFFYEVNSHPDVRSQSIDGRSITWAEHERWYAERLADPDTLMWVIRDRDRPVGVVSVRVHDPHQQASTISIALAPAARGRGVGAAAIRSATDAVLLRDEVVLVVAMVKPANAASGRAFQSAGYERNGDADVAGLKLHRYVRRAARGAGSPPSTR